MNNKLKNFLGMERGGVLTIGDRILVNKILDLVEKEVKEKYHCDTDEEQQFLSTIINNLRV